MLSLSRQLPESSVRESLWSVHRGNCPKCQGPGPVDVHVSHRVWSALFLTRWTSTPQVSCRSCGIRSQLAGAGYSLVLGWWGFPWGFIMTPIQIGRNIFGMMKGPDPAQPSAQLERAIRLTIVAQVMAANSAQPKAGAAQGVTPN